MSSYYGILLPEYWDGRTGKAIQQIGGVNATLLGAYLMANRRANMIGLYRLPVDEVRLPIKPSRLIDAFAVLAAPEIDFALYDTVSEFVWVKEMARIRMGLRTRSDALKSDDNRIGFVNRLYREVDDNPFLAAFYARYVKTLHLNKQRTSEHYPKMSPLERGWQAPPKPVNRIRDQKQRSGSGSGSETDQDQGRSAALARRDTRTSASAHGDTSPVIRKLTQIVIGEHPDWTDSEIRSEVKQRAADARVAYSGPQVSEAMDLAIALRRGARS